MDTKERPDGLVGFSGVRWLQYRAELDGLLGLVSAERVRSYLEVGAHHGDTWHEVGRHLPSGSVCVAVDWPGKTAGAQYGSGVSLRRAAQDLRVNHGQTCFVYLGDSQDPEIVKQAGAHAPFDLVFIDGDHSYAGAKADWLNYGRHGRLVAFHDINQRERPRKCEVFRLYDELCATHKHVEFSAGFSNRGIGVVWC